jgi:periplasmic copper chaperone A
MKLFPVSFAAVAASMLVAGPVAAHITLVNKTAAPGSNYMAAFRVPHGCEGAATIAVRIKIPAGVYDVKPVPKAGWKIEISSGKYDVPFANKGAQMNEGVTQVSFTGGSLPDGRTDEFVVSVSLADSLKAGTTVYFPLVQECEGGKVERWIEIPAAGKVADDYKTPAPGVRLGS